MTKTALAKMLHLPFCTTSQIIERFKKNGNKVVLKTKNIGRKPTVYPTNVVDFIKQNTVDSLNSIFTLQQRSE